MIQVQVHISMQMTMNVFLVRDGVLKPTEDITPFIKTPFTSMTFLPTKTITETIDRCHSEKMIAMDKDLIWSMSLSRVDSVPM